MAKKYDIPQDRNILPISLEEAMPENYLPYAVEVAKDRALPDVRDGLKPVHRRILYGAYGLRAFPDKPYLKSARIVGDILGKYHPHGDSSVYDAMVILAQNFSTRMQLMDGHGNWGSVDGDNAAAMRYTEARLSEISLEMLKDIDKNVVNMVNNYSDTEKEPEVLPARFPNLLVNGAFGIAVGLATNIPPHNLGEVIDGVVALSENKDISTEELMEHIKGPDLPTGGQLIGKNSILNAYEKGRGKVTLRAKSTIEKLENGRFGIVITEFPYRKNKAKLLQTISEMTGDKKHAKALESITDIRDESDRNGIRSVIEFKKSADRDIVDKVLKYLYKKTELQCNLSFNMVALVNGKPQTLGLKQILRHYLEHQKDVVTRRTKRELEIAEKRFHIVEGFIKAIGIMDEVIATIRQSKSKKDAAINIINKFGFTEIQAEAILELMLYKLTGLEIATFEKEYKELEKKIEKLNKILSSEKELLKVIKKEINDIKKKYADDRRTNIIESEELAKIDIEDIIVVEDTKVTLSKEGFVKRIALKSFNRSSGDIEDIEYREGDYNMFLIDSNTKDTVLFFTDKGNAYQMKGIDVPEYKWKDKGERIDTLIKSLDLNKEKIVDVISLSSLTEQKTLMFFNNKGGVKKIDLYKFNKNYAKLSAVKLKEEESIIKVILMDIDRTEEFIKGVTRNGLIFTLEEPSMESSERNTYCSRIIPVSAQDEMIDVEITEEYEYREFNVSVTKKGILKPVSGSDKRVRANVNSSSNIMMFMSSGAVYNIPGFMIQNINEKGINLKNIVDDYKDKDEVVRVAVCNKGDASKYAITITKLGMVRKTKIDDFLGKELTKIQSKLKENDGLVDVVIVEENYIGDIFIVTKNGMFIRFEMESVSATSKTAKGITGISLKEGDVVVYGNVIEDSRSENYKEAVFAVKTSSGRKGEVKDSELIRRNRATIGKKIIFLELEDYIKEVKKK